MSLEKDFKKTIEKYVAVAKEAHDKINAELATAEKAIGRAQVLSEQYGIPFHSSVSPLYNHYTPASFEKKWSFGYRELSEFEEASVDEELDYTLYDYMPGDYSGWEHSAVC